MIAMLDVEAQPQSLSNLKGKMSDA